VPKFGNKSESELVTCHPDLQKVIREAIKHFDFSVLSGRRYEKEQRWLVDNGYSKTMNSKHLSNPSRAVDVAPYPIDWKDRERFTYLAGHIMGIASMLGIKLRWLGDEDRDTEVKDNRWDDLGHFELVD
jgi:hypothetical protein